MLANTPIMFGSYLGFSYWQYEILVQHLVVHVKRGSVQQLILKEKHRIRIPDCCLQEPLAVLTIVR